MSMDWDFGIFDQNSHRSISQVSKISKSISIPLLDYEVFLTLISRIHDSPFVDSNQFFTLSHLYYFLNKTTLQMIMKQIIPLENGLKQIKVTLILIVWLYSIHAVALMFASTLVQPIPKQIIRYHDPYIRLQWREMIEDILDANPEVFSCFGSMDAAAIIDAVVKRGGTERAHSRLNEIALSLPYYDTNLIRAGLSITSTHEALLTKLINSPVQAREQPFIEHHLLPVSNNLHYYHMGSGETTFMRANFSCMDEYLSIKSLAYWGGKQQEIPQRYIPKYQKLRQYLYIHDMIHLQPSETLSLQHEARPKVCIVGITIPNLIMACKFARLSCEVEVVEDDAGKLEMWEAGVMLDGVKVGIGNQVQLTKAMDVIRAQLTQSQSDMDVEPVNGQRQDQTHFCKYQYILMAFLDEVLKQYPNNSTKLLWDQLNLKASSCNNFGSPRLKAKYGIHQHIDPEPLRAIYDRFLLTNSIKDMKSTTVGDIYQFLSAYSMDSNKIKMAIKPTPIFLNIPKINQSPAAKFVVRDAILENMQWREQDKKWALFMKDRHGQASQQKYYDYVVCGQCIGMPEWVKAITQQLVAYTSLHFLYTFKEKILFKQLEGTNQVENEPFYSYANVLGLGVVHFFQISDESVVASVNIGQSRPTNDYYKQIGQILKSQILKRPSKQKQSINGSLHTYTYYQSCQQAEYCRSLGSLHQSQQMYSNMPILATQQHSTPLLATMEINNVIMENILGKLASSSNEKKGGKHRLGDLLGLDSPFVRQWLGIVGASGSKQDSVVPVLDITNPLLLRSSQAQSLYLLGLGRPHTLNQQQYLIEYTSIRVSHSHSSPTQYYQTCILYQKQPVYCVVRLCGQNGLVLFHGDLEALADFVAELDGIGRHFGDAVADIGQLWVCPQLLCQYLHKQANSGLSYSEIINNKLKAFRSQDPRIQPPLHPLTPATAAQAALCIFTTLSQQVSHDCQIYGLRQYSLADIFTGKLNFMYLMWELCSFDVRYGQQAHDVRVGLDEETRQCVVGIEKVQMQMEANGDSQYGVRVADAQIWRRFITNAQHQGKYQKEYKYYPYPHSVPNISPYPCNCPTCQEWIQRIIRDLLAEHMSMRTIVRQMQKLIRKEMENIANVKRMGYSDRKEHRNLYYYVRMTRMHNRHSTIMQDKQSIVNKMMEGEETQWSQGRHVLGKMVDDGDIIMLGNQYIIVK